MVIQARDLGEDGRVHLESAARLESLPTRSASGFLRRGDILLQPRGTRFPAAILDSINETRVVAAAPMLILRVDPAYAVPEYLVAVLQSPSTQAALRQLAAGTYVPQVSRQAIENLPIQLPDLQSQAKLAHLASLEQRERELMERLREARGRLFDLAVIEVARKARKRANASGPEPVPTGARAPRGP